MFLEERTGSDDRAEGRRAAIGNLSGREQDLAVLLEFGQRRIPDESAVDVAALPCRDDFRLRDGDDLGFLLGDAFLLEHREQLVVIGRDRRRGELLALEIGRRLDAGADNERFAVAGNEGNEEALDVDAPAHRGGKGTGADVADLHVAGSDGGENFGAELKRRNSMSQPVFLAKSPLAMPTK